MSLLTQVRTGSVRGPQRTVLHGIEGIGKTTFAASAPNPIFVGPEDGQGDLDIPRFTPRSWGQARDFVRELIEAQHNYRTVVIDTIDRLEQLCWQYLCDDAEVSSIEKVGGGYGKGYTAALEAQVALMHDLDELRQRRGMHVICLAHSMVKTFNNPDGTNFDRYQMRMNEKAASKWKEWADVVLFANYDVTVKTEKKGEKALLDKGKATAAKRMLFTTWAPAYDAKNRFSLPEELPLSWDSFAKSMRFDEIEHNALVTYIGREAQAAVAAKLWTGDRVTALIRSMGSDRLAGLKYADLWRVLEAIRNPMPAEQAAAEAK